MLEFNLGEITLNKTSTEAWEGSRRARELIMLRVYDDDKNLSDFSIGLSGTLSEILNGCDPHNEADLKRMIEEIAYLVTCLASFGRLAFDLHENPERAIQIAFSQVEKQGQAFY